MKNLAFEHFGGVLGAPVPRSSTIDLHALDLPVANLEELEADLMAEDIWIAIKSLPRDKAPGPDRFMIMFYQRCWPVIKDSVMAAVDQFCKGDSRNFSFINQAYITLLPKRDDATDVTDFHPTILIRSSAKIIVKALANKLAPMMEDLISRNQSAFIRGRCIQDNFALVQRAVKSC